MPRISKQGRDMPSSPIRKLTPFADHAKKEGKKVYHLNIGQPDIETPQVMLDAVKSVSFSTWAYTASEGTLSYRTKLAGYYNRLGYPFEASDILVTNGGSEAITIAMQVCLDKGDEIIVPEPFYANYNSFAFSAGATVVPILSTIDNGFALPDIADFEKLITSKTRAIAICTPNNPTGYLYSREELKALGDLCLKHDLFLISDEAYREFCYDDNQFVSPLHLSGLEQHVIIVDTISKRYSACGARLGCLATKNKEVWESGLKYAQARLSPPGVAQIAAEAAIDTPQTYFDNVKSEYTARRNVLVQGLNDIEGVFCPNPRGAFYVMARLPIDDSDNFCRWMLEHFDYNNQTVMMAPGTGFYSPENAVRNEVRLAYVLNTDDLKSAVKCIEEGLKVYPGRIV